MRQVGDGDRLGFFEKDDCLRRDGISSTTLSHACQQSRSPEFHVADSHQGSTGRPATRRGLSFPRSISALFGSRRAFRRRRVSAAQTRRMTATIEFTEITEIAGIATRPTGAMSGPTLLERSNIPLVPTPVAGAPDPPDRGSLPNRGELTMPAGGQPVEHHVVQNLIVGEALRDVAAVIGPAPQLLKNPGSKSDRRVNEAVAKRLRTGRLQLLVGRSVTHESLEIFRNLLLGLIDHLAVAECQWHVQVDSDQMVGVHTPRAVVTIAPQSPPWAP